MGAVAKNGWGAGAAMGGDGSAVSVLGARSSNIEGSTGSSGVTAGRTRCGARVKGCSCGIGSRLRSWSRGARLGN